MLARSAAQGRTVAGRQQGAAKVVSAKGPLKRTPLRNARISPTCSALSLGGTQHQQAHAETASNGQGPVAASASEQLLGGPVKQGRAGPMAASALPGPASRVSDATSRASQTATLLVQCPDAKGVVASLSQLLYGFGCNIVSSDQFSDLDTNMFFQRISFDYADIVIGPGNTPILERAVSELATRFDMKWKISYRSKLKRVAVLVSKLDHCLYDLLIRHRSGELRCEIPCVISNHPDLGDIASMFNVPFHVLPQTDDKAVREKGVEDLVAQYDCDTIILARYMQIFSKEFTTRHWDHTINIHHSFLPAFEGARPYHRAHERGVKIIGATAHYATDTLDAGPIIDQNTTRITHRDSVSDMIRKGRDLERLVLARAVRWHLDDRILVYGNKTVVFED